MIQCGKCGKGINLDPTEETDHDGIECPQCGGFYCYKCGGWKVVDDEDVCKECAEKDEKKKDRPATKEEMLAYMASIDIYEADRFPWEIVFNGWAADYAEAEIYLETIGIFPWDD